MVKKSALGKGLGALIKQSETEIPESRANATNRIDIRRIEVNPYQPRTGFDPEALEELAVSIKQLGIIQPITVREIDGGQYQIISGERRYRASLIAGLTEIPAYVRHADDSSMLELALVENIQREDLDAIEVAVSYQRLIDECRLTQENVSERVGKKRSTIANYLRLLKLPAEVQLAIRQKQIGMGHARALVNIEEPDRQLQLLHDVVENGLSVRQAEAAARQINNPQPEQTPAENEPDTQNSELATRNPEPETQNSELETRNPKPETQNPEPETRNPKLETRNPKLETRNPELETRNSKPETRNPELETRNPEPETRNPEPETPEDGEVLIYEDRRPPVPVAVNEDEQLLVEQLSRCFGTKVDLKRNVAGAGRVVIPFRTDAELQYILQMAEKMQDTTRK